MQQFFVLFCKFADTIDIIKESLDMQVPEVPGVRTGMLFKVIVKGIAVERLEERAGFVSGFEQKIR